jgi:type I restriction enzyme S subunit
MNETMPPPAVSDNTDGSVAVPPGYKRTEVGIIPEEWTVASLGEIATIATGNTPPTHDPTNYGDEYPFVSPTDLGETKYVADTDKKLSKKGFEASRRFPANSILFVSIGSTIGKCGIAPVELTSNQQINAVFPSCDFSTDYLYYILCSVAPRIRALAGEQAVPIVNKTQFSETVVPLPPLLEQRAIAALLSDADGFIGALDALIEKKREIKQAAMQQLLTGKKRLPGPRRGWEPNRMGDYQKNAAPLDTDDVPPGYKRTEVGVIPEGWEFSRLGDCGEVIMGQSPPGASYNREGVGSPLINGPTEFTDLHPIKIQWTTQPARFCKLGDLLICVRGSSTGRINYADNTYAIGRGVAAIRAKGDNDTQYISYQVISGVSDILTAATGSTFPSVDATSLKNIVILLPSPPEQTAIAAVLSDMDAEIAAFERRREKAKQIKQGMMQQLLTGRIRLSSVGRVSA